MSTPPATPSRRPPVPVLAAAAACLLVVLVVAVSLSGGAPRSVPAGVPDAGAGTGWGIPVVRLLHHLAAVATVGTLLVGLLPARRDYLPPLPASAVAAPALLWTATALAHLVLATSEGAGRPVSDVLQVDQLRAYASDVPTGRALLLTAVITAFVAAAAPLARHVVGRVALLLVCIGALVPPLRTAAAASADHRTLAAIAVVVHVAAVMLWVGGLATLLVSRRAGSLATVVPRFSTLALLCFVAVAGSGAVVAYTRLPELSALWTSGYGGLLLAKVTGLVLLGSAGAAHRRWTLPGVVAGDDHAFRRLAAAEVVLMGTVLALAVALTRTSP